MSNTTLETVKQEKDLGVLVDDRLKFDLHVKTKVCKANKILGLIRRSFDNLDKDTLTCLKYYVMR